MGFLTRCLMRRPLMVSYLRPVHSRDQCLVANAPQVKYGGWRRTRTPPPRAVAARLCCSTLPASWIALRPRSRRPSLPATPACRLRAALAPAPPSTLRALRLWLRLRLDSPLRAPAPHSDSTPLRPLQLPDSALRPGSGVPVAAPGPQLPDRVCVVQSGLPPRPPHISAAYRALPSVLPARPGAARARRWHYRLHLQ